MPKNHNEHGRKQVCYLMRRRVEHAIGCIEHVQACYIVPPILNFCLKRWEVIALQINLEQSTRQQVKQTWWQHWRHQRRLHRLHPDTCTCCTCSLTIVGKPILPELRSNIFLTPRVLVSRNRRRFWHGGRFWNVWNGSRRSQNNCPIQRGAARLNGSHTNWLRRRGS